MPNFQALKKVTKQVWLYFICRTRPLGIRGCHHRSSDCFEYPQKSLLKSSHSQKNTVQISLPQKIPESKILNPKKSFDHPRHLKSQVAPLGLWQRRGEGNPEMPVTPIKIDQHQFSPNHIKPQSSEKVMRVNKLIT